MPDPSPSSMPQPPFDAHGHDTHCKNANALHREALLQALGSIISPVRVAEHVAHSLYFSHHTPCRVSRIFPPARARSALTD
ncbi:unnamed protein product [Mycena citricolor]|uniref:Uncharacterized protein n=1 Tax=Mycena citricolor TaxID=2018698 RepID=A0AAD2H3T3_9AGAR|nr:unnamed protein product [Mycena citricolor]